MKRLILSLIAAAFTALPSLQAQTDAPWLLSDNVKDGAKSQAFPDGVKAIETGASCEWIDSGKYATDSETLSTGRRPNGTGKCLFDGIIRGKPETQTFGSWGKGKWATLRIDLKDEYLIGAVDVWAFRDKQRDTESVEVLLSSDGESFNSYGFASNAEAPRDSGDFVKLSCKLEKPVLARVLELRAKRLDSAMQQQLGEIAVWGWRAPLDKSKLMKAGEKPPVKASVRTVQDGAALISWKESYKNSNGALKWRVYKSERPFARIDEEGVTLVGEFDKGVSSAPLFPFEPGSTVHFGVTAVYKEGEYPAAESVPCKFRTPYQCEKFGDMLAINHYWSGVGYSGGGANVRKPNPDQWNEVALDLLAETPATESRWWMMSPEVVKKFLSRGIGMITFPRPETIKQANSLGLHSFSAGNEPEYNRTPEKYIEGLKDVYAKAKAASKWNCVSAPTSGTDAPSLEWLEKFYAAGGKDFFDVMDIHTYTKINGGHLEPEGYPKGAPEALFDDIAKVREIMKRHGDEAKPIISTEFGFTEATGGNPSGSITPLSKAQYLVRGLVLHYVLGFKRVYVYSFWDEGADPFYTEHLFGMIDYDLQKKPAFQAFCALGRELGNCILLGELEGCARPSYGYLFKNASSGDFTAIVWDGSGERAGDFHGDPQGVVAVDLFGKTKNVMADASGAFKLPFGPSPVYIRSKKPLKMLSSKRIDAKAGASDDEEISFALDAKDIIVKAGALEAEAKATIKSSFRAKIDCSLAIKDASGATIASKDFKAAPGSETKASISFKLNPDSKIALQSFKALLAAKTQISSFAESSELHIRRLTEVPAGSVACEEKSFAGSERPLAVLANELIEASFDPSQGGRLVELIDRRKMANQINMDYGKLPSLKSFAFEYSIWFDVDGLKNARCDAKLSKGGSLEILFPESKRKLQPSMKWSLPPGGAELRLDAKVANNGKAQEKASFKLHPEYKVGGTGDSVSDVLLFPTSEGIFKLPFWTGLGERTTPKLSESWWAVEDTAAKVELRQSWSGEWKAPRIWFGNGSYNLEMGADFEIEPGQTWSAWLTWKLKSSE